MYQNLFYSQFDATAAAHICNLYANYSWQVRFSTLILSKFWTVISKLKQHLTPTKNLNIMQERWKNEWKAALFAPDLAFLRTKNPQKRGGVQSRG